MQHCKRFSDFALRPTRRTTKLRRRNRRAREPIADCGLRIGNQSSRSARSATCHSNKPGTWSVAFQERCDAGFDHPHTGHGLAETAESALVARLLPDALRGSGFGLLGAVQSLGDFVSSAAVGLVWTIVSPRAAFLVAAAWMLLSLLATGLIRPEQR